MAHTATVRAVLIALLLAGIRADAQTLSPADSVDVERRGAIGAVIDSFKLLMVEHATRIVFQEKTRRELGGPFFQDYVHSVRIPQQWGDTDAWAVNYIGHPIHGAAAGYIWIDHERGAPLEFSSSKSYWSSRARATAWAASYSLQFEVGPVSEASIGNVGKNPATAGWVDHVITPAGAFGFIVAEDALDRYVVKWIEERTANRFIRGATRIALNPGRALSNSTSGRSPWHRAGRPLNWRQP